jgi:hypothetical protein
MAKIVEFDTPEGPIAFTLDLLEVKDGRVKVPDIEQNNYKAAVLDCHKVLDELQIPTAKGQRCGDPSCPGGLGHRLRELRKLYLYQVSLIQTISETPENAEEILSRQNKSH